MENSRFVKQKIVWLVILVGLLISVAGNVPGLLELKYADINDWQQFNALSLFTRSCLLHYKTIIFYDPWTCGGTDVFANPQNRLFSPMIALDILFPPQLANLMSLIVYGMIGFVGCFYLLRRYRISFWIAIVCSAIFINAQWFGLHFSVGHIPFGSFLLIPWVLLSIINIHERKYLFLFASLCALFLLDGGFYSFIFSIVLLLASFIFGLVDYRKICNRRFFSTNWLFISLLAVFFCLTVSVKIIPVLTHKLSPPEYDALLLPVTDFFQLFCDPLGTPLVVVQSAGWMLHEFGCYVGIVACTLIFIYLFNKKHFYKSFRFVFAALFFFWIGTGWGGLFNPWSIIERIPLVNIAHMQSRYFLLMYLFLVIILAFALQNIRIKKFKWLPLALFLIAESLFVRIYPMYTMFELGNSEHRKTMEESIITTTNLAYTVLDGQKPFHYFTGNGSKISYEPMGPDTRVRSTDDSDYMGETYFKDRGLIGWVQYMEVIPGRVTFDYRIASKVDSPVTVELNLNYLAGWKVLSGNAKIVNPDKAGLINVEVTGVEGSIVLQYSPWYLIVILPLFILGLLLWIYLLLTLVLKRKKIVFCL